MRRIPSLDGLRAVSVMLVILGHLEMRKHISLPFFGDYANLGVRVFFVLSGYLITNLLLREQERTATISLGNFYLRRAYRIFPAAAVYLAIISLVFWHEMHWYYIGAAALYVVNMVSFSHLTIGHLWSLGIEEQFYLVWPFVLKRWYRYRTGILVGVMLGTPVFRLILYALHVKNGVLGSLPAFADQLAIGCLLAIFAPQLPKISGYLALAMLAVMFLVPRFAADAPPRTLLMLFLLHPMLHISIAGVVLHVIQVPYRILNWAPISWLGKISYSLYLWQQVFCFNRNLHYGYALILPSLACACLSYYLVEQPILRLREKRARKPEEMTASVMAPTSSAA
jgi:peptidoglycan/LPS O-acetylase OafA/YrhL